MTAIARACEIGADAARGNTLDRLRGDATFPEARRMDGDAERGGRTRHSERIDSPGIEAFYSFGTEQRRAAIQSISPTGVFLLTEDCWLPGTIVQLTLQQKSGRMDAHATQVRMAARVVRQDLNGVGMEFLLGKIGTAKWLELFTRAVFLTEENDPVCVFRVAKALAFLLRIAPLAENRILDWITSETSPERVSRSVAIALCAESLLAGPSLAPRIGISSNLVCSILEEGSKAPDGQAQQFWSGLLVSICLGNSGNEESASFIALLSRLDSIHIRILAAVGSRTILSAMGPGVKLSKNSGFSHEEIARISGGRGPAEIDAGVHFLESLGLIERIEGPVGCQQTDPCDLAPSELGVRFYARCSGQSDSPHGVMGLGVETLVGM